MTAPIRRRTRAREIAMQVLFQFDVRGESYASDLGKTTAQLCADESADNKDAKEGREPREGRDAADAKADLDIVEFATRLVEGTLQQRATIDQKLAGVTRNWDIARMANVDRNVLRMAVYELMFCADVPPKVAINEAIELGKKYSTANSGGFVNGILDRIRIDLERDRTAAPPPPAPPTAGEATA